MYSHSEILIGIEGSISRFAFHIPFRHQRYNNNLTRSDKKLVTKLLHHKIETNKQKGFKKKEKSFNYQLESSRTN
jgi:hypothetical protein